LRILATRGSHHFRICAWMTGVMTSRRMGERTNTRNVARRCREEDDKGRGREQRKKRRALTLEPGRVSKKEGDHEGRKGHKRRGASEAARGDRKPAKGKEGGLSLLMRT